MKNFARFLIFLSLCVITVFIITFGIALLRNWTSAVSLVPITNSIPLDELIKSAGWTLPFTIYLTIILSMNCGKKLKIAPPLVFIFVTAFTSFFAFGVSSGFKNFSNMAAPPLAINHGTLGYPGLILSRAGVIITMLDQPSNETGSRVVSIEDQPFIYQKVPVGADGTLIKLPPVPFRYKDAWLSNSVLNDLFISGRNIAVRLNEGYVSFWAWLFALIILLVSLGFIFDLSRWPLANVFLSILAFRGILAFEVFLNSDEVIAYLKEFSRGILPDMFITPVILSAIAVLILIYRILLFLSHFSSEKLKKAD
ncbi:MAG: hypothetical protein LBK66_10795 [Spirochaetaceae bacterium]|jgi:hypothetical protein|nr:hypothetical protein [Spirochaetaceae bacterium]